MAKSTTITFNYGSMNSGKSLELIKVAYNFLEQGYETLILKAAVDTRMPGYVYSRTGLKLEAIEIDDNIEALNKILDENCTDKIAILVEEANFLTPEVIDLIVDYSYQNGIEAVMFYGLKVDFRGNLFPGTVRILERADKIVESTSVCWCGKKARQNGRVVDGKLTKDGPTILIEDGKTKVEYVTLCNYHYALGIIGEKN